MGLRFPKLKDSPAAAAVEVDRLDGLLESVFGFDSWRPGQREAVDAMAAGRDVVAILPTGSGKSLCYQMAALTMRGTVVVVSPLIALMVDQVRAARDVGLSAYRISSGMSEPEYLACRDALQAGTCQILFVSPERFVMPGFLNRLYQMRVAAVVVDEAHLVAEWGGDFRPEYWKMAEVIQKLKVVRAAFTATATKSCVETIVEKLGMRDPVFVRSGFDRPNLRFLVTRKAEGFKEQFLGSVKRYAPTGRGIVYQNYRGAVDGTVDLLRGAGYKVLGYHAGMGMAPRNVVQAAFQKGHCQIIVATVAFGLGIDLPDIRWVLHGEMPLGLEQYYQGCGRAGRDGAPAVCEMFWSFGDQQKAKWFVDQSSEDAKLDAQIKLRKMSDFCFKNGCRRRALLQYFGEAFVGRCGRCDWCEDDRNFKKEVPWKR